MPHICTRCNNVFHKGDDILKGCPVCGWKKFLFTKKVTGEIDGASQRTTITKAMGVRIPPRAEPKAEIEIPPRDDIKEKISPLGAVKEEIRAHSHINETESEAKENAKVESIRITAPGTYELNLPSLFEREELIMAVKEGTYLIDLTSAFRKGKKE
jgi:predicted  nucleic acid-binding Zn-ribbon protein